MLLGDEAVMRVATRIVKENETNTFVIKAAIAFLGDVLREQRPRIMIPRDLVDWLLKRLARFRIDGVLGGAAGIDNVAKMKHEIARQSRVI